MNQPLLFNNELVPTAQARKSDPITSVMAADRVERSGSAQTNRERVLAFVQMNPGHTSAEIAQAIDVDRHEGGRRVSDLIRAKLVRYGERRVCDVKGTTMQTVWSNNNE